MSAKKAASHSITFGIGQIYREEAMMGTMLKVHPTGTCLPGDKVFVGMYTVDDVGLGQLTAVIRHFRDGGAGAPPHHNTKEADIVDTTCWKCVDKLDDVPNNADRIVAAFRVYMEVTVQKFDLQMSRKTLSGATEPGRPPADFCT